MRPLPRPPPRLARHRQARNPIMKSRLPCAKMGLLSVQRLDLYSLYQGSLPGGCSGKMYHRIGACFATRRHQVAMATSSPRYTCTGYKKSFHMFKLLFLLVAVSHSGHQVSLVRGIVICYTKSVGTPEGGMSGRACEETQSRLFGSWPCGCMHSPHPSPSSPVRPRLDWLPHSCPTAQ